ncbi:hypothetical protein V1477_000333 [Vespula maculifrons]|uniref:Uncharacterized protein n=1 Tax=Vespula maculifrons TaxID=7453 RepID=A0ABD2D1A9_VESMC
MTELTGRGIEATLEYEFPYERFPNNRSAVCFVVGRGPTDATVEEEVEKEEVERRGCMLTKLSMERAVKMAIETDERIGGWLRRVVY